MIYSMITGDMLTFGIIYTVFLFGFSQAFYFLYKGFPGVKTSLYSNYPSTWMALFQITMGNYDYSELSSTTYPGISKSVFALFMVFVPILLLNMLIAMMGNTYAHVIEQSEKEWVKQWAKIVITLERAIPQADAHKYLQEYSISLGPSEDPSTEQRGVMVIKSKSKTRAKQRKGAVANWKRVGKVTIHALKKKGLSGEEMRCLMWGRESINTPIKTKNAKPKAQPNETTAPNLMGGFGDALTTALDVMAFTHELDINGAAQGLTLANNAKVTQKNAQNDKMNEANKNIPNKAPDAKTTSAGKLTLGSLTQLKESDVPQKQSIIPNIQAKPNQPAPLIITPNQISTGDPLRELVMKSMNRSCDSQILLQLAQEASNLQGVEEISCKSNNTPGVKNLAGIFAGTSDVIKKMENSVRKRLTALEPSGSEDIEDVPILGKISRKRRAKSANKRKSSAKITDKTKLVNMSESSSTDTMNGEPPESKVPQVLDYAEERMRSVKESLKFDTKLNQMKPFNIEYAMGEEQLSVTISETLRIQGLGDGAESEAGNSEPPKKKKRPKTSRNNRVAPSSVTSERACKSAIIKLDSDSSESPDPLEPWSTKDITNMNKILAWENDQDSL